MNNKEFSKGFESRTKEFAIRILKLSASLPDSTESTVIRNQISRSGTSVGANYREANRSRSKADFRNRIKICESGASETVYWLEIIAEFKWVKTDMIAPALKEASEILAIFTSIASKL